MLHFSSMLSCNASTEAFASSSSFAQGLRSHVKHKSRVVNAAKSIAIGGHVVVSLKTDPSREVVELRAKWH